MKENMNDFQEAITRELYKATQAYMGRPVYAVYEDERIEDIPQADTRAIEGYIAGLAWALNRSLGEK